MALLGTNTATTTAFSALDELLTTSKNTTELLDGFSTLMSSMSTNTSSTSASLENTVLTLLVDKNVQKTLTDITKYPDYVESLEKLFEDKSQKQYWWLGQVTCTTSYNSNFSF